MADNKNKGGGEFDDDAFDVEDFSDADFDEAALDDDGAFDDLPPDDGDFEGDDFESEDWNEEEEPAKKGKKAKKEKSLYQTGERSGLSFNTIVIIGAVVVGGGVMAYNIISKTAEVKSTEKTVFQSILNIGGVMDGTLFGDKAEEPTPEQIAAQEQQTQTEGFLNNPDVVTPPPPAVDPNAQANPPQPSPIMPTDGTQAANEPLVPMPETTPSTEAPRGPDDVPPAEATVPPTEQAATPPADATAPVVAEEVPAAPETTGTAETADTTATPSAEDILKQAMANREQKANEEANTPPAEEARPAEILAEAPKEEVIADTKVPVVPLEEKAPEPATPAEEPSISKEEMDASKQALASLEGKLDTILKRMEQIESDLGSVKESKNADYEQIQQTVQSLKTDIAEIKDRPAPAPVREKPSAAEEPAADAPADEPAPAPVKKKAAKKKAPVESSSVAPAPAKAVSGRWELRAAQPGRAWVSRPGERDMQTVEVGQSLAGIGRVTGITYQNNRWTILGTQGQIQQ